MLLGETVLWVFFGDCHYTSVCSYAQGTNIAVHESVKCVAIRNSNLGRHWQLLVHFEKAGKEQIPVHSVV